jgi:hypothetical protein
MSHYLGVKKVSVEVLANKDTVPAASSNTATTNDSTDNGRDEIRLYIRGRFLCSMDAVWRTLGYQTYPATEPSVFTVKCKLPEQVKLLRVDGKCCDMLVYLHDLKMHDFFKSYDWGTYYM